MIQPNSILIAVKMTQVGGNDDETFISPPQVLDHICNFLLCGITDYKGY